jgi:hypothetical protein
MSSKKIDESAELSLQCGSITREILEGIGKTIAGDSLLFHEVCPHTRTNSASPP